jgi:hypothetical protein
MDRRGTICEPAMALCRRGTGENDERVPRALQGGPPLRPVVLNGACNLQDAEERARAR